MPKNIMQTSWKK